MELFRDSIFGKVVRLATRNKYLQFQEEQDPEIWQRSISHEKSNHMADHGTTEKEEEKDDDQNAKDSSDEGSRTPPRKASRSSSNTQVPDDQPKHEITGKFIDREKGKDVHVVDWYDENDPENPMNWSRPKKYFVTFNICLLTFSIYIGSAIYSAGTEGVMMQFGVGRVAATLGLCLFVAGYGLGPMIWSPLSEIPQIGRNPIYFGTLLVFVFFQFAVIYATNFGMLLAFRFLTGFFGSPVLATGGASLGDMYRPQKRAYAIAIWGAAAVCGPVLGPLIGGFAVEAKGWQWAIWELLWLSGFCAVFVFFFLPETSSANILYRRSRRLRKITGNEKLKCEPELESEEMSTKDIAMMTLVLPFSLTFTEPICFFLNLYIALIYGLLYCWFESYVVVFIDIYQFSLGTEGLAYLGILIGVLVCLPFFCLYLYKYTEPQFNENGELKPEKRLPPACVGAFFLPVCLFWFGWTSRESIHWMSPIIASSLFGAGTLLLFNAVLNYLGDAYPKYQASVLAGNDLFRSSFGAGFPLFAGAMYDRLGVGWASSLLGFLSIAFIPIPFVLYFYGEKIRKASKRARHDL